MARNLMTLGCSHRHAKASTNSCLCVFRLSFIFCVFPANSIKLGMWLNLLIHTCASHHNHLDCPHLTMGGHLLWLESITHHGFQFGLEGLECLLPSMVLISSSPLRNSSRIWPTMKFSPTSLPPLWSNAPCPFMDKRQQTIVTSLWLNPKFCIQTILKTLWKSKVWCIARIHLILLKTYVPWLAYISYGQFLACSQKHHQDMPLCAP